MSLVLFFVYLGDAVLSDWVPSYMQTVLGSSVLMGLVMSFSSVVGLAADLVFPQLLQKVRARKLILMAIGTNLVFSGVLVWTTTWSWLVLFLLGMAVWGIYYELLWFGSAQFVADSIASNARSGVWAVIGIFKSLAYFLGPILGSWLVLSRGNAATVVTAAALVCLGYVIWAFVGKKEKKEEVEIEPTERFSIVLEMSHWKTLFGHVWQVLLLSLTMGLVDATFWTTGTVLSDNLAKNYSWGGMFLPLYMLPPIFMGIVLARLGVYKGKKKISELFLLLSGVFLFLLGIFEGIAMLLLLSFLVGLALSIAWPMVDAVYSDILARMGKERKHMVGLSSSTVSLAYILGPILTGIVANRVGERMTFSIVGLVVVLMAVMLLITTPKKTRLPQSAMAEWQGK